MAMITVDGHPISRDPSKMTWGLQDISAADAGRVQNSGNSMLKNRVSQKRKISLTWNIPHADVASEILKAFNPEYFNVMYYDPMDAQVETRKFYAGDRSAEFRSYQVDVVGGTTFQTISFDIIEV